MAMQWNFGAFAGSAFGAMVWMVVPASMGLGGPSLVAGLGVAVCTVVATLLWRARGRVSAHAALQVQLAVSGLAALAVVIVTHGAGKLSALDPRLPVSAFYSMLLIFPFLSVVFWVRERRGGGQAG